MKKIHFSNKSSPTDKLFSFFTFKQTDGLILNPPINYENTPSTTTSNTPPTSNTQCDLKSKSYKKKSIPKNIKLNIWNTYIGDDIMKHKCFCCKKNTIKITDFEAGHVISEFHGGSNEITNFRPICRPCNLSMGTMHMEEYVKKYGLYI